MTDFRAPAPDYRGVVRLLLLNSANYAVGDFPLHRPLSISGANNRGKSTAINALQFLVLNDLREMQFPRSSEDTRQFYFHSSGSYVLAEVVTDAGTFTIGAGGLGPASGFAYQLFAYKKALDDADYLAEDGQVRTLKEVGQRLLLDGVTLHKLSPQEMRGVLFGHAVGADKLPLSIGLFRLKRRSADQQFMTVFKGLLQMSKIRMPEIKPLLIQILLPTRQD